MKTKAIDAASAAGSPSKQPRNFSWSASAVLPRNHLVEPNFLDCVAEPKVCSDVLMVYAPLVEGQIELTPTATRPLRSIDQDAVPSRPRGSMCGDKRRHACCNAASPAPMGRPAVTVRCAW